MEEMEEMEEMHFIFDIARSCTEFGGDFRGEFRETLANVILQF